MNHLIPSLRGKRKIMPPLLAILVTTGIAPIVRAQPADASLEKKVRVVLETHCFKCHSHQAAKDRGKLMLDSRSAMLKGGETSPAIVPGHPEKSLLIKAINHEDENLKMPEKGKLAAEDIALLTAWVKAGAPWTDRGIKWGLRKPGKITDEDRRYWAFQPINAGAPPAGNDSNPIDRFILARLQNAGIKPGHSADPRTLIRRLYFDVIGLPPTPEVVELFITAWHDASAKPQAARSQAAVWEQVVDPLLASPHYGQRLGRRRLPGVRFAHS